MTSYCVSPSSYNTLEFRHEMVDSRVLIVSAKQAWFKKVGCWTECFYHKNWCFLQPCAPSYQVLGAYHSRSASLQMSWENFRAWLNNACLSVALNEFWQRHCWYPGPLWKLDTYSSPIRICIVWVSPAFSASVAATVGTSVRCLLWAAHVHIHWSVSTVPVFVHKCSTQFQKHTWRLLWFSPIVNLQLDPIGMFYTTYLPFLG